LLGSPDSPECLEATALTYLELGRSERAAALLRRLAELRGGDPAVLQRLGEAALLANDPGEAEAAFMKVADSDPTRLEALEGVARAARARGERARSQAYYERLLALMGLYRPAAAPERAPGGQSEGPLTPPGGEQDRGLNESLPGLLARRGDDSVRIAGTPPDRLGAAVARVYLSAGYFAEGVQALLAYQTEEAPPYPDADYLAIAAGLDQEGEGLGRRVGAVSALPVRELTGEALDAELDALHDRSDKLATLAERMRVSDRLDPAHRYRVLAYNLLNQSNFEALMYFRTHDRDRRRRADLLREAFRKARLQAQELSEELSTGEEGMPSPAGREQ